MSLDLRQLLGELATPSATLLLPLALSFLLSVTLASLYRTTHAGASYSQSYAQTLVIMGMVVALIMVVVGSSVARAFSLVGALSIIRFRSVIKETRDLALVFMVIAIGMACGTRAYLAATLGTLVLCSVVWCMFRLDLFRKHDGRRILRVRLPADLDHESVFGPVLHDFLDAVQLLSLETVSGGAIQEVVYSVLLKKRREPQHLLEALRRLNQNHKVSLVMGVQDVDL